MSKNKSKLKWLFYTGEMFDVYVTPNQIKRLHAPLESDLVYVTQMQCRCLHLRPGIAGLDKDDAVVKYLYCTRDGRFFAHNKDGWGEKKYDFNPGKQNHKNGSVYPCIRDFGNKNCHLCVAYAWHGARPEGMVCDHLDGNKLNMHADNLQWVTTDENRRRAKIARRMRQIALDPKLLTPTLCKGIYSLPQADEDWVGEFIERYKYHCSKCLLELSVDTIRLCVADALDNVKSQISNNHGSADRKK